MPFVSCFDEKQKSIFLCTFLFNNINAKQQKYKRNKKEKEQRKVFLLIFSKKNCIV